MEDEYKVNTKSWARKLKREKRIMIVKEKENRMERSRRE